MYSKLYFLLMEFLLSIWMGIVLNTPILLVSMEMEAKPRKFSGKIYSVSTLEVKQHRIELIISQSLIPEIWTVFKAILLTPTMMVFLKFNQ
ncbi:Uncharacterised protein [Legionella pneumophila]|nr:Uncharacterised protein [Legionella pneumophila]